MLKYLISTCEYLLVTGVLLGMLSAYLSGRFGQIGRRLLLGFSIGGLAAAAVMAYLKNKTKLIDTGKWNIWIFSISMIGLVLFLILDTRKIRERLGEKGSWLPALAVSLVAGMQVFYALPDVLAYPYTIALGGESIISTGFLYRVIGIALALILVIVTALAAFFVCRRVRIGAAGTLLKIALLIVAVQQVMKILQMLLAKRIIVSKSLFQIVKFTANHANLFTFGVLIAVVVFAVVLWLRSFHVQELYANPAEHRKIRANWLSIRRWSSALIVCFVLSMVTLTAVKAYEMRPVELSQVEACEQRGDNLYVSFEQVADGHLHRFAYTTENQIAIRFIVIQKPNSSAYGIGLDACDICGETGYYEENGQVICNRCDVVMNINTIGFKGGCNPKVIDYQIENGYIIVPISTLLEHESDFK